MVNKRFLLVFGIIAIMMAYVFNMNHAVDNYGITKSSMSIHVLAQDTTNNGGGNTGGENGTTGGENGTTGGENGDTGGGGDEPDPLTFSKVETISDTYVNGKLNFQKKVVDCYDDGPYDFCINSCTQRMFLPNSSWGPWEKCPH